MSFEELAALVNGGAGAGSTLYRGCFYCGSRDGVAVFRIRREVAADSIVQIDRNELPDEIKEFEYTDREDGWVDVDCVMSPFCRSLGEIKTYLERCKCLIAVHRESANFTCVTNGSIVMFDGSLVENAQTLVCRSGTDGLYGFSRIDGSFEGIDAEGDFDLGGVSPSCGRLRYLSAKSLSGSLQQRAYDFAVSCPAIEAIEIVGKRAGNVREDCRSFFDCKAFVDIARIANLPLLKYYDLALDRPVVNVNSLANTISGAKGRLSVRVELGPGDATGDEGLVISGPYEFSTFDQGALSGIRSLTWTLSCDDEASLKALESVSLPELESVSLTVECKEVTACDLSWLKACPKLRSVNIVLKNLLPTGDVVRALSNLPGIKKGLILIEAGEPPRK